MKLAKYVVIAQVALSVIMVVIFVTRSNASNRLRAKADDHRALSTEEHVAGPAHADKASKAELADKPARGEAAEAEDEGDETHGKHARKPGRLAQADGVEGGEITLDVKAEARGGKPDERGGKAGKDHEAKDREAKDKEKDSKAAPVDATLGTDPKVVAQNLLAGNARFVEGHRNGFDMVEQRESSAGAQHPGVMVLGCADSRVPPELIFDRGVGEMFVVRSAGNIAEPVAVGSLEYAAEHLHTKVLLILGHEKCGAVQAALSDAKMGSPNLEALVDAISPAVKELKAWVDGDQLVHMAVEANVRRQADEVMRRSPLLRTAVQRKELTVLKAVYDLQTGHVRPL
jgi:carbonic anhydrase